MVKPSIAMSSLNSAFHSSFLLIHQHLIFNVMVIHFAQNNYARNWLCIGLWLLNFLPLSLDLRASLKYCFGQNWLGKYDFLNTFLIPIVFLIFERFTYNKEETQRKRFSILINFSKSHNSCDGPDWRQIQELHYGISQRFWGPQHLDCLLLSSQVY